MSSASQENDTALIEAELTWTGGRFERGLRVAVTGGRITGAGMLEGEPTIRFPGKALIPGFVNAHSHAFQRGLRGRGETFAEGVGSFWSWREAMYRLASELDAPRFLQLTRRAFAEMRLAGFTSVGEFHYFHHSLGVDDFAFDELVLEAAAATGIRLALLNVFYASAGFGQPLSGAQQRFRTASPGIYWKQHDRLERQLARDTQSLGVVAHSIRAASPDEIAALHSEAKARGLVFHMHLEEQQKEIDECIAAYGQRPLAIVNERLQPGREMTAVHATHSREEDLRAFLDAGANVCITPLTEANLGDGIPSIASLLEKSDQLAIGSDSNARISPIEELRWLEYVHRLSGQTRGVFRDEHGEVGKTLLKIGTEGGARSLGLDTGRITPDLRADFALIDLEAPALHGWDENSLLDAVLFGATDDVIVATAVGGKWLSRDEVLATLK